MNPHAKWLAAASFCLAFASAYADTAAGTPPASKLPAASAPPACVCTTTNTGHFFIANCQCGSTQCIVTITGSGNVASNNIACVK